MKRIHIISMGDEYLMELAVALKDKGYAVSCSGMDDMDRCAGLLKQKEVHTGELNMSGDPFNQKVDWVVSPFTSVGNHPELLKAKEAGSQIMTVPELILRMAKDKTRIVLCNPRHPNRVLSVIMKALRGQRMRCDYVALNGIPDSEKRIGLSYDTRISLLEGDAFLEEEPLAHQSYKPHILIMSDLLWRESKIHPTFDSYVAFWKDMVMSIERDGKLIYNQAVPLLQEFADSVREDITAIPYTPHQVAVEGDTIFLDTRYGRYPVIPEDAEYLGDINAARLACRQLGVNDKEFYSILFGQDVSI